MPRLPNAKSDIEPPHSAPVQLRRGGMAWQQKHTRREDLALIVGRSPATDGRIQLSPSWNRVCAGAGTEGQHRTRAHNIPG